jgi:predicted N-acetyltransferase YhbS
MTIDDIDQAVVLSDSEDWGFDAGDFRRILDLWPGGSFVCQHDERVIGMVTTASHEVTGWIGNVLVEESHRGKGIGRDLVDRALDHLGEVGMESTLLYSYAGLEPFYEGFGFRSLGSFSSYLGQMRAVRRRTKAEEMAREDLADVYRLDHYAFGDDRSRLLARIHQEFSDTSLVLRSDGELVGFAMAWASDVLTNIGPAISISPVGEGNLLESLATLLDGRDCFLAAPDPASPLLGQLGLVKVFGTTKMVRGPKPEEDVDTVVAIGTLEKG